MGRDCEEDGAEAKPQKHISFEDASLDGSDEDEGAVEVSAVIFLFFILLFSLSCQSIAAWTNARSVSAMRATNSHGIRSPSIREIHTGGRVRWSRPRPLCPRKGACRRANALNVLSIN